MPTNAYKVALGQATTSKLSMLSPYAALEASWINFAILMGLKEQPWGMEVIKGSYPPYIDIWVSLDLMKAELIGDGSSAKLELTEQGEIFVELKGLFEYEHSMIEQQLSGDFTTDPEKYKGLRIALAKYTEIFLQDTVTYMLASVKENSRVLDYGGGAGYYLSCAMSKAIDGHGVLLDKSPDMALQSHSNIDVVKHNFADPKIFMDVFAEKFDVVILSEVAHCLGKGDLAMTFNNIHSALETGGRLILIEQGDNFRLNQRLFDMTKGGTCYSPPDLAMMMAKAGLKATLTPFVDNSHFTMIAEKV